MGYKRSGDGEQCVDNDSKVDELKRAVGRIDGRSMQVILETCLKVTIHRTITHTAVAVSITLVLLVPLQPLFSNINIPIVLRCTAETRILNLFFFFIVGSQMVVN